MPKSPIVAEKLWQDNLSAESFQIVLPKLSEFYSAFEKLNAYRKFEKSRMDEMFIAMMLPEPSEAFRCSVLPQSWGNRPGDSLLHQ
ncbi:MAG: hypothetical protein ACRENG_19760 [bacterium]